MEAEGGDKEYVPPLLRLDDPPVGTEALQRFKHGELPRLQLAPPLAATAVECHNATPQSQQGRANQLDAGVLNTSFTYCGACAAPKVPTTVVSHPHWS